MNWHIGRSWHGTRLEDRCPCPKAHCGLVIEGEVVPECPEHSWDASKTIRQRHSADYCPGGQN